MRELNAVEQNLFNEIMKELDGIPTDQTKSIFEQVNALEIIKQRTGCDTEQAETIIDQIIAAQRNRNYQYSLKNKKSSTV